MCQKSLEHINVDPAKPVFDGGDCRVDVCMRRKGKVQPADLQRELALGGLFVVIEQIQDAAARWLGACWIEKVLGRDPTPALVPVATLIVNRWRRQDPAAFCVHAGASSPAH